MYLYLVLLRPAMRGAAGKFGERATTHDASHSADTEAQHLNAKSKALDGVIQVRFGAPRFSEPILF